MNSLETIVSLILKKASEQLLPGEMLALAGSSSLAEIRRIQFIGDQTEFSVCQSWNNQISTLCLDYGIDVKVPRSILNELFFPSDKIFDLVINVFDSPPNISSSTLAPLVTVHIGIPGYINLSVHNLTNGIQLSIPNNYSNSVACAFWDSLQLSYSSAGIHTAVDDNVSSNVHCTTNHLSSFTLIPGIQLQTLTTSLLWPGLPPTTTSMLPGDESSFSNGGVHTTKQESIEAVNVSLSSLDHPENLKLGLIVGLITGFTVFITAIVATVIIFRRRKPPSGSEMIGPESVALTVTIGSNFTTHPEGNDLGLDQNSETLLALGDCSPDIICGTENSKELNDTHISSHIRSRSLRKNKS
jgi:hypothetical protein